MSPVRREAHHDWWGDTAVPWINDYFRADGTRVKGHVRLPAGARRETALLGLIVAGVIVFGNGTTSAGGRSRLGPGVTRAAVDGGLPDQMAGVGKTAQRPPPIPTVSYPVVLPSTGNDR
ncbi:hypothetical protein GCM10020254_41870 [Streptomyces goshikiensis]